MVIIFSQSIEHTTTQIIDWIAYNHGSFKRINGADFYRYFELDITNKGSVVELLGVDWKEVNVIWLWRWSGFEERHKNVLKQEAKALDSVKYQLNQFLKAELKTLVSFFFSFIPRKLFFSRAEMDELNKLMVLHKAQEFGIAVPKTYVLSTKEKFSSIVKKGVITKALSNAPIFEHDNETYLGYTTVVEELPGEIDESFSPSLFQDLIEKKYEIRSFLVGGKFYSMAIFSQADEQTSVDFRVYNYRNPNRTVPFKLPQLLEDRLIKLLDFFQLTTASIDIIKTKDNEYVFLEINASGQFGMVSYPCNFYLEKKMASELLNYHTDGV